MLYNNALSARMRTSREQPQSVSRVTHTHTHLNPNGYTDTPPPNAALNKVFTSQWLDAKRVVVGTKCSSLAVLSVETGATEAVVPPIVGFYALPSASMDRVYVPGFSIPTKPPSRRVPACTGIHGSAINPSKTLIAVSAGAPLEFIQIYTLPQLDAYALLQTHSDMVFAVEFISDSCLISGGRDGKICFWDLDQNPTSIIERIDGDPRGIQVLKPVVLASSSPADVLSNLNLKRSHSAASSSSLSDGAASVLTATTTGAFNASFASLNASLTNVISSPAKNLFAKVFSGIGSISAASSQLLDDPLAACLIPSNQSSTASSRNFAGIVTLETKVRDLKLCKNNTTLATLTTDGVVKLFDIQTNKSIHQYPVHSSQSYGIDPTNIANLPLTHRAESVCLAPVHDLNLLAIGGMSHISFVDTRSLALVGHVTSVDPGWGVRSLAVDAQQCLAVGSGLGRIAILDPKMRSFRGVPQEITLETGIGGVDVLDAWDGFSGGGGGGVGASSRAAGLRDLMHQSHSEAGADYMTRDAIYTLSYCPYGVRLFAAGGPLQLNCSGSYAGIWE
ncbi:hypothetical protein HDU78_001775 [Chytriomyces hyalinus]|nr:hypothetical protein HDU78_001775 [Chytriomyces hyalinus]